MVDPSALCAKDIMLSVFVLQPLNVEILYENHLLALAQ